MDIPEKETQEDALARYKRLLDEGEITQEDYRALCSHRQLKDALTGAGRQTL